MPSNTLAARGVGVLAHVELHVHDAADALRLAAVDHELQRLLARTRPARASIIGSSPSSPCLRAMLLHSTIFVMSGWPSRDGGRMIQGKILSARCMTGSGVWMQMAAIVPTTTIMNAAAETQRHEAGALAARRRRRMAFSASTSPMMLRMSNAVTLHSETRQQRIDVCLARGDIALGDSGHRRTVALAPGSRPSWRARRHRPRGVARLASALSSSSTSFMTLRMIWPVRSW